MDGGRNLVLHSTPVFSAGWLLFMTKYDLVENLNGLRIYCLLMYRLVGVFPSRLIPF